MGWASMARGAWGSRDGNSARACKENDAVAYLAVALAPAAVVGLDGGAAAHVCATWMFLAARARAVAVFHCATAVR